MDGSALMESLENFYIKSVKGKSHWEVFHATACVYALIERQTAGCLKPFNLTPVKFNALMLIKHQGQAHGLSQNEICHHLIVSPSNITRLLDRLTKEGLITRSAQANDRRVNLVKITKKGSILLDRAWPSYCDMVKASSKSLNQNELNQLSVLLLKWFAELEAGS